MSDPQTIKTAFDRNVQALEARPKVGLKTAVSRARIREGLTCDIQEGNWKLVADLSPIMGGNREGPDPGVLGRAALGSCLAIGYVLWASRLQVPLTRIDVEIQADFDARGQFGWEDVPAGYTEVRYQVSLESDAPREDVLRVADAAEKFSSYLDVFGRANKLERSLTINGEEA